VRTLITGATGFLGRHVVRKLQNRGNIIALLTRNVAKAQNLANRDTEILEGELGKLSTAKTALQRFDPDVCIHLAWAGIPDFSADISKSNLDNSIDFLQFIGENTKCRKIIVSGSCAEYGKAYGRCKESDDVRTPSFFVWAKQAICNYASLLCEKLSIDLIWFRIFYVYGPGQRTGSLIPSVVHCYSRLKRPEITSPENKNDYVYVEDVAEAFLVAATNSIPSGIYNIGSGVSTSAFDVSKTAELLITGQSCKSEQLRNTTASNAVIDFWAYTRKTKDVLGWKSRTSLEEGIQKTIHAMTGSNCR
jgi:nucleoside-diphosphate-sugar epimerase